MSAQPIRTPQREPLRRTPVRATQGIETLRGFVLPARLAHTRSRRARLNVSSVLRANLGREARHRLPVTPARTARLTRGLIPREPTRVQPAQRATATGTRAHQKVGSITPLLHVYSGGAYRVSQALTAAKFCQRVGPGQRRKRRLQDGMPPRHHRQPAGWRVSNLWRQHVQG